jgi:hypothetical protein
MRKIEIETENTTVIRLAGKELKRRSWSTRYRNLVIRHE